MRKIHVAIVIGREGKYRSFPHSFSGNENLVNALGFEGIVAAHLCNSKKSCMELVGVWNEHYKKNGDFLDTY